MQIQNNKPPRAKAALDDHANMLGDAVSPHTIVTLFTPNYTASGDKDGGWLKVATGVFTYLAILFSVGEL